MVKRRNVIFGVVVFLLVAAVVAVIVLAALGDFSKKGSGGGGSGTNTDFRPNASLDPTPHATTCIVPVISGVNVGVSPPDAGVMILLESPITPCGGSNSVAIQYDIQLYKDGAPVGGMAAGKSIQSGSSTIIAPFDVIPAPGNYTATATVWHQNGGGYLRSPIYNFSFSA